MNLELFIAKRIHFNKDGGKKATPPAIRISLISIALGLAVMILSVAIILGFKQEVRNKVIGFGSHIRITNFDNNASYETQPIAVGASLIDSLKAFPNIESVELYATKPGMIKTDSEFEGFVLKGVDSVYNWSFFEKNLKEGSLPVIGGNKSSNDVLISRYLANRLDLKTGDDFLAYFIENDIRARKFKISGIYDSGFEDYDKLFVVGDMRHIRRLNGWDPDMVSGIELYVKDYGKLDDTTEKLTEVLLDSEDRQGMMYYVRSIKELNPMIFGWLDILDTNVVIILVLMMAVSGFTMIAGLLIIILERTNMIGILKALGEGNRSIRKVFLYLAFFLIGKGMIWGNAIGLSICFIQKYLQPLKLNSSVYYLDAVPIELTVWHWLLINVGALLVSMVMMLGPTYLITKIEPAKSIRFE